MFGPLTGVYCSERDRLVLPKNFRAIARVLQSGLIASVSMEFSRRTLFTFAGGATLLGVYSVFIERYLVQINEYEVPVAHLPPAFEGYRIAHLTDLHLGLLVSRQFVKEVVSTVNDVGADMIACTGDYVHDTSDEVRAVWPLLSRLHAPDGALAVLGNHDHWADEEESLRLLESSGMSVRHRVRPIVRGDDRLLIFGAGDHYEDTFGEGALPSKLGERDALVVLAHNPDSADFKGKGRVDLMLSGHTHGGQVRVVGWGAPILPVENKLYDQGLKRVEQTSLFISRGIGWAIAPVRFACAPEIAVLTLVSS